MVRLSYIIALTVGLLIPEAEAAGPDLYFRIARNFRIFKTDETQRHHLQDYCIYMRCAAPGEFDNAPPFCKGVIDKFKSKNENVVCPGGRLKEARDGTRLWYPNIRPKEALVPAMWDNAKYQHALPDNYFDIDGRRLMIYVTELPSGAFLCDIRLSRDQWAGWKREAVPCDDIPWIDVEVSGSPYTLEVDVRQNGSLFKDFKRTFTVSNVTVVALGDSISSGEGLPHRLYQSEIAPDQWLERRCHRSYYNFTALAMATATEQARTTTFSYLNFACSGATIKKIDKLPSGIEPAGGLIDAYNGTLSKKEIGDRLITMPLPLRDGNFTKESLNAQIDDARAALTRRRADGSIAFERPDYVVLTIGGNDMLFGSLVFQSMLRTNCEKSWAETFLGIFKTQPSDCLFKITEGRRKAFPAELLELAQHMKKLNPRNVLIVGYLDPTHDENDKTCQDEKVNDVGHVGIRLLGPRDKGADGYLIDSKEAELAYSKVLRPLNDMLREFTEKMSPVGQDLDLEEYKRLVGSDETRWRYVDPNIIRKAGMRGWCARPSWFVNYDDSFARQNDQLGTAHPNIYGQNWLNWMVRCYLAKDKVLSPRLVCRSQTCNCRKLPPAAPSGHKT